MTQLLRNINDYHQHLGGNQAVTFRQCCVLAAGGFHDGRQVQTQSGGGRSGAGAVLGRCGWKSKEKGNKLENLMVSKHEIPRRTILEKVFHVYRVLVIKTLTFLLQTHQ